jgi:hypothetical protein
MKKPRSSYHKMINSGGQGCIFEPAIPCYKIDKKARKRPKRKNQRTVSKVSFNSKSTEREMTIDDLVRKIPDHESWAILWDKFCETPTYRKLAKRSDIKECLDKKHIDREPGSRFPMLVGPFGGHTIYEMGQAKLKKSTFKTQVSFDAVLEKLLGTMESLFEGLVALRTHQICHGDLSVRNVLVKDNRSHMIDFGLSYRYSNKSYLKKRVSFMREIDKTYDPYPYEYILYSATRKQLQEELEDTRNEDFREGHEDYVRFHEVVLGRTSANTELEDYLDHRIKGTIKKPSLNTLVQNLDTYSVGILIPTLLHDIAHDHGIPFKTLKTRCQKSKHKEFFALCRDMTEFSSSDRLSARDSLRKFSSLIASIQ